MSVCKQCGQCCYKPERLPGGRVRHTLQPCPYLDIHTKKCKVYEYRHFIPHCDPIQKSIRMGLLPFDCAYVTHFRRYTPALAFWEDEKRRI